MLIIGFVAGLTGIFLLVVRRRRNSRALRAPASPPSGIAGDQAAQLALSQTIWRKLP